MGSGSDRAGAFPGVERRNAEPKGRKSWEILGQILKKSQNCDRGRKILCQWGGKAEPDR